MADSITISKICTKCGEDKPLSDFAPDSRYAGGLKAWCRTCQREYARQWREQHAEAERERHRQARLADLEHHREKVRKSYQKHKAKRREAGTAYYFAHQEQMRAAAKVRRQEAGETALLIERESRARIRCIRAGSSQVEVVDYAAILARDGFWCHICKEAIAPATLQAIEFDHIIPVKKGGAHTAANIAVSHLACNKRKWDKVL